MNDDERLQNELKRATRFAELRHAASCDSTQDLAASSPTDDRSHPPDAVFWADHQRVGRGRQQREWHDEAGLDLAVTFRVTTELPRVGALPAALPVAVLRACEEQIEQRLRIKWPNDVFAGHRKLSGVLIDRDSRQPDTYRIGIGINVNRTAFDGELASIATSLSQLSGGQHDRGELLLRLANEVEAMLTALEHDQLDEYQQLFRDRLGLLDRAVTVVAGETRHGVLTAIDFEHLTLDGQHRIPLAITTTLRATDA